MRGQPSLTRREHATLQAVARRLTNSEIAEEFGVSVRTVESHIAALRRKLHAESRRELIEAARGFVGRPAVVPTDAFLGRTADLEEARGLLRAHRWITVTGPAGVGKTRLALELTRDEAAVVVELEHSDADGVVRAIASALGVEAGPPAGLQAACEVVLSSAPVVLVLDNADRVAAVVGDVVVRLLARAEGLRVVVTSRTPTHGSGEIVVELGPLELGADGAAAALFRERARAVSRSTDLSDGTLLAAVCERLDGIPLAIELAAARTRHLDLAALVKQLEVGFAAVGATDGALRPVFESSWDLLPDRLRDVLTRLAALPRTFDLDLVESVLGRRADADVLDLLDRSLIVRVLGGESPRFRMLAALREFVLDRAGSDVVAQVLERHSRYYVEVAAEMMRLARTDDRPASRRRAQEVSPEISAALDWAVRSGAPTGPVLARAIGVAVEQYGPAPDMVAALRAAAADADFLARCDGPTLLSIGQGLAYSDVPALGRLAEVAAARNGVEDRLAAAQLHAFHHTYRSEVSVALEHLEVAERLALEIGDRWTRAWVLQTRGNALARDPRADLAEVMATLEAALAGYAEVGDAMHVNNTRYMMAAWAGEAGAAGAAYPAAQWADACVQYATSTGNDLEIGHALLARAASGGATASTDLAEAGRIFRRCGDLRCLTRTLLQQARLEPQRAEATLQEALSLASSSRDDRLIKRAAAALITTLWAADRTSEAAVEVGALAERFGEETVDELLPPTIVSALRRDRLAVLEGRSRQRRT